MSFFNKNDIVEMAVKMEQNGFAFYDEVLQRQDLDAEMMKIITRLRDDEKEHEKTFLELRNQIDVKDLQDSPSWQDAGLYLESVVESHVFKDAAKAIQLAQKAKDKQELLQHALQFEKDTILFFFSISKQLENKKAQQALDAIINEETTHIRKLRALL